MMSDIHELADRLLPGDYTVERVEFSDGDSRARAKHTISWSSTMYITHIVWKSGQYWLDYYENDRRVARRIYSWRLEDRII